MSGIINTTNLEVANIKDSTGTNTAMTVDSSGRVTQSQLPFFNCLGVDTTGNGYEGKNGHLSFPEVQTNQGNHYNTTGHYFLAPVAGVYNFSFQGIAVSSTSTHQMTANTECQVMFQKSTNNGSSYVDLGNGAYYYRNSSASGGILPSMNFSESVLLAVNDRVRVNVNKGYIYYGLRSNKYAICFSGHLVG